MNLLVKKYQEHFERIDDLISRVNTYKVEPEFSQKLTYRQNIMPNFDMPDSAVLEKLINRNE